jgi:hypothetical protein
VAAEERIAPNYQSVRLQLGQFRKYRVEILLGAGVEDMEFNPEIAGRRKSFMRLRLRNSGIRWD